MQQDLFASAPLPGLRFEPDFVGEAEERQLIERIDETALAPFRFQGWTGKRLTASFGFHYDFDRGGLDQGAPIPPWMEPLRTRAARLAGLDPGVLVQLLLTRYDPGAGIGWHRDRPAFDQVVGVSLGAPATLRFRRRRGGGFDRFELPMPPRSLYVLSGGARSAWEHGIAPMSRTRWSVTLRSLRP